MKSVTSEIGLAQSPVEVRFGKNDNTEVSKHETSQVRGPGYSCADVGIPQTLPAKQSLPKQFSMNQAGKINLPVLVFGGGSTLFAAVGLFVAGGPLGMAVGGALGILISSGVLTAGDMW